MNEYVIQGNYGLGWEDLTFEETESEAKARLVDYDLNERNVPHRVILRKV